MSKPKPGLGKGIVRTLAVAQHPPSLGGVLTLAPVVGQHYYSSSASASASAPASSSTSTVGYGPSQAGVAIHIGPERGSSRGVSSIPVSGNGSGGASGSGPVNGNLNGNANGWSNQSSYVSLLPSWDQISNDIVLSYSAQSRLRTSLKPSSSSSMTNRGVHSTRRYSSVSISPSAFLTSTPPPPPPPPASFFFDRSLSFSSPPTPAQSSLDALLASLEIASGPGSHLNGWNSHRPNTSTSDSPPYNPAPLPGPGAKSSPQQPLKALRPSESHTTLSAPLPQNDASSKDNSVSLSSHPLLALHETSTASHPAPSDSPGTASTAPYASSLIFHLGASGLPKERLPSPRSRKERPPTPPRQRSFPLPEVEPPTNLTSVAVGEDAYFARPDGMCIADGVGGWSRSGKGNADAGRWSRLLTHFCEEEVGNWWAGKEVYLVQPPSDPKNHNNGNSNAKSSGQGHEIVSNTASSSGSNGKGKQRATEGKQGWAKELWEDRQTHKNVKEEKRMERRPLDPVEIMQRGFEKCLACVLAEGIHGSSTCLLALLHNATLHIANLGDCCLLLIRQGEVVFRTSEMQHAFNFPLQVGTHSRDEPMKDAKRYDVGVKKGDVVVLGSDGLMDNLFDEDILEIVAQFTSPKNPSSKSTSYPPPKSSLSTDETRFPAFNPQHISDALCRQARSVSELVTSTTPFMAKAIEEGIDFVGGKKDDISVVVGVIGDRETGVGNGDRRDGPGTPGGGGLKLHL